MTDVRFRITADAGDATKEIERAKASLNALPAASRTAQAGFDGIGMSAKQTAAAMRGVPAQITDIVTSLQGGQQPLTVFLQQGGQLKDMFGGVVPAAKALGGAVLGLINPLTLAAGAAGAVAVAFYQGAQEARAYEKALILSGNAIGMTSGQLETLARDLGNVVGTQGQAAGALAEMAGSSLIAARDLGLLTEAAVELERVTGQKIGETRKQFEGLAKAPLDALLKLNEGTNFLTTSLFDQVKALEEQGKKTEAAEVAQRGYARAMIERAEEVQKSTGWIEQAWDGVTGAAKRAWDAMLNVGREKTAADQLARLDAQLAAARKRAEGGFGQSVSRGAAAEVDRLQAERDALAETIRLTERMGQVKAETAAKERAAVAQRAADLKTERGADKERERSSGRRRASVEKETEAQRDLTATIKEALSLDADRQKAAEVEAKLAMERLERYEAAEALAYKQISTADEMLAAIQRETAMLGMSNVERETTLALLELEKTLVGETAGAYDEYAAKVAAAIAERESKKSAIESAAEFQREFDRVNNQIGQSLSDALMGGGRSAADYLKGLFRQLVLRPVLSPIASAISAAMMPGSAAAAGGGSSAVGTIGQIAGLSGAFGTGLASSFSSMASAGIGGWASAAGSLMGTGSMAGVMAGAGMVAAPLAAAYALYSLLSSGGEKRAGSTYGYSAGGLSYGQGLNGIWSDEIAGMIGAGQTKFIGGPSGGEIGGDTVRASVAATVAGIDGLFERLGSTDKIDQFWGKLEQSEKGRGGVFAGGSLASGVQFGEASWESGTSRTLTADEAIAAFALDLQQATIQALQASDGLPQAIAGMLEGVDAEALGQEQVGALLASVEAFSQLGPVLDRIGVGLGNVRVAAIDAAGGVDQFGTIAAAYYDATRSDSEKLADATSVLREQFAALGVEAPASVAELRATVEALMWSADGSTDAGQALIVQLMALAPALAQVEQAGGQVAATMDALTSGMRQALEGGALSADDWVRYAQAVADPQRLASTLQESFAAAWGQLNLGEAFPPPTNLEQYKAAVAGLEVSAMGSTEWAGKLAGALRLAPEFAQLQDALAGTGNAVEQAVNRIQQSISTLSNLSSLYTQAEYKTLMAPLLEQQFAAIITDGSAMPTSAAAMRTLVESITDPDVRASLSEFVGTWDDFYVAVEKVSTSAASAGRSVNTAADAMRTSMQSVADFVQSLYVGDLALGSPEDQLAIARSIYEDTLARAPTSAEAMGKLAGVAGQYAQLGGSVHGTSTGGYADLINAMREALTQVSGARVPGVTSSSPRSEDIARESLTEQRRMTTLQRRQLDATRRVSTRPQYAY